MKVRYIGIDTPEIHHPMKGIERYGKEASEANRKLVDGKTVRLEFDVQEQDRYGRLLAYVYLEDGTFVNAWLVENGYAMVMTIPPNVKYQQLFLKLQREAREGMRGLWTYAQRRGKYLSSVLCSEFLLRLLLLFLTNPAHSSSAKGARQHPLTSVMGIVK